VPCAPLSSTAVGKTAIVTGANQGLGFALVAELSRTLGPESHVYLTGRHAARVEAARVALADTGVRALARRVDVRSDDDVAACADLIRDRHGAVDVVISNAAARLTPERPPAEQVRDFVETNNLGTTRMIHAFAPLVAAGGSFLVVASAFGSLRNLAHHLHARFEVATLDELDAVLLAYTAAVEAGAAAAEGWPDWINVPSKVGQVAAARIVARDERAERRFVAAVCPGLIDTAASRPWFADMSAAQSPATAAVDVVALAAGALRRDALHGELVQHGSVIAWR
jgi:carbonyl reductase 1